jgi:hypothetical protein
MHQEIIEMIREGDLDDHLGVIKATIVGRENKLSLDKRDEQRKQDFNWYTASRVKVIGKLKPNYLMGYDFEVKKINPKSVVVSVPDTCKFCQHERLTHDPANMQCLEGDRNSAYSFKPLYGRFSGMSSVRIPKTALEIVA